MNILHPIQEDPYLALAHQKVETDQLNDAVNTLRTYGKPDISTHWSLANALVEAATHSENQDTASSMLREARSRLWRIQEFETLDDTSGHVQLSAAVFEAFMPLFRQALVIADDEPETSTMSGSHQALLSQLHDLNTPRRVKANSYPNGGPAWEEWDEAAIHMLMARLSLRQGSTTIFTWPSFARHHIIPDTTDPNDVRHDWNIGVGFDFLGVNFQRIALRSNSETTLASDIQPLSLKDIGLKSAKSILTKLRDEQTEAQQLKKVDYRRVKAFHKTRDAITNQTFDILAHIGLIEEYDSFL